MANRSIALVAAASLLLLQFGAGQQALAQYAGPYPGQQSPPSQSPRSGNQMGYQMMSSQEAASLPRGGGTLGLTLESTQQISEQGLSFSVLRVTQVRPGSPAAAGGMQRGDNVIAVNGLVFPGIREFAQYVGSLTPGATVSVDFIPRGTQPDNAQRMTVRAGSADGRAPPQSQNNYAQAPEEKSGMSTRMKLGLGAAALFGCYELGCFASRNPQQEQQQQQQQGYPQQGYQQQQRR